MLMVALRTLDHDPWPHQPGRRHRDGEREVLLDERDRECERLAEEWESDDDTRVTCAAEGGIG